MNDKTFISWSGGKDSSLALYRALQKGTKIGALLTSVNAAYNRISMHGVRRELLEQQALSLRLPLYTVELPEEPTMAEYESGLHRMSQRLKADGFTQAVYGDIFLEDLKAYRETQLAKLGLEGLFPLWKQDSGELMTSFLGAGFKAVVVCVNDAFLDRSFCGRLLDESFVKDLPAGVDVCGENGEYHSFVFDGPIFSTAVAFVKGAVVFKEYDSPRGADDCFTSPRPRTGFYFQDLLTV